MKPAAKPPLPDASDPAALVEAAQSAYDTAAEYGVASTIDATYWHAMAVLFQLTPSLIEVARRYTDDARGVNCGEA